MRELVPPARSGQSRLIAPSGHSSAASSQQPASSQLPPSTTWLIPSSPTSKTSGQMSSQIPQPVHRSGSTLGVAILHFLLLDFVTGRHGVASALMQARSIAPVSYTHL